MSNFITVYRIILHIFSNFASSLAHASASIFMDATDISKALLIECKLYSFPFVVILLTAEA
jgi:hypothetical protein